MKWRVKAPATTGLLSRNLKQVFMIEKGYSLAYISMMVT